MTAPNLPNRRNDHVVGAFAVKRADVRGQMRETTAPNLSNWRNDNYEDTIEVK